MISSIDSTNTAASLMAQNAQATTTTRPSPGSFQTTSLPFLPISSTPTPNSFTETVQTMISMLQNFISTLSTMLGGGNQTDTSVKTGSTDRFDFLRQVDQEPVTIISPREPGTGGSRDIGDISFDNEPPTTIIDGSQDSSKVTPRKKEIGKALKKNNGEFLWKPESDKDGKLAILLPKKLTGKVKNVRVLSPDGSKVLERGKFSGVGNGDREHFRFSKSGSGFPDGAIVVITMEDGTKRHIKIKETSDRTTR